MRKIVGKSTRRISTCFMLSGPAQPTLSRIKARPLILAPEMIRSRADANQPRRCPDNGASDEDFPSLARMACRGACVGHGLVRAFRPALGRDAGSGPLSGSHRALRRTVRAFHVR